MHDHFDFAEPEEHFTPGSFLHLIEGSEGRVLDGRYQEQEALLFYHGQFRI